MLGNGYELNGIIEYWRYYVRALCVLRVSAVLGNGYGLDSMTEILKVGCWYTTDLVNESGQMDVL